MGSFFKRLSGLIARHHKIFMGAAFVLALGAAFMVLRIEFKTDMLDVLPSNDPDIVRLKEFLTDFGSADNLVVVVEAKEGQMLEHVDAVEDLASRLAASTHVEYVDYNALKSAPQLLLKRFPLFLSPAGVDELMQRLSPEGMNTQLEKNRETLLSPFASPASVELISKDPLDIGSIVLKSIPRRNFSGQGGYYLSKDHSMLIMLVKPKSTARDLKFIEAFGAELSAIINEAQAQDGGVKIGLTGPYAFAMEAQAALEKEVVSNFFTSTIIIILLFQFVYRKRPLTLLLTFLTLLSALAYTLASAYLLFGGLNMVSSIVTIMLVGVGDDYVIHVLNRWEEEFRATGDSFLALEAVFTKVLPGVVTGAITTSMAFFSIVFTNFTGMYEFGILAGIGVLSCCFTMIFFLCSALVFFGPRLVKNRQEAAGFKTASGAVFTRRPLFLSLGAVVVILSVVFIPKLKFDSDPESIGLKDSPVMALEKKVTSSFGAGKNPLIAVAGSDTKEGLLKAYDMMEAAAKGLEADSAVSSYSSLRLFLPAPSDQQKALGRFSSDAKEAGLKERFLRGLKANGFKAGEYQERYILGVVAALKDRSPITFDDLEKDNVKNARHFYNSEKLQTAAYLFSKDGWDSVTIEKVTEAVKAVPGAFVTGAPVMLRTLKGAIIRDSAIASVLTYILITAVVYAQFRKAKWVFAVQLSLMVSFLLTLGAMSAFGVSFNYINIGAVALIFGIGVDYSVYMTQGYLEDREMKTGVARIWKTVLMCAITTLAGFGSLITMSFEGIASLGLVITIGVMMCLFTSLVLLPSFLALLDGKKDAA